jgi:hypothetical protein
MTLNVLVVTKGHPFDQNAFRAMLDANPDIVSTFVDQPAAQVVLGPEHIGVYDAVLFYDMCGISSDPAVAMPPAAYVSAVEALLERGSALSFSTTPWCSGPPGPSGGRFPAAPSCSRRVNSPAGRFLARGIVAARASPIATRRTALFPRPPIIRSPGVSAPVLRSPTSSICARPLPHRRILSAC